MAACGSDASVSSNRLADAFAALIPFQIVGTLGMAFFLAADEDAIWFDAAVSRYDDRTEAQAVTCFHPLGEVDFLVHVTDTSGFWYHQRYHVMSTIRKQRFWRRGGDSNPRYSF